MDNKKLTIDDILNDTTSENEVQSLEKAQKKVGRKKSKNAKRNKFNVLLDDNLFKKLENEIEKLDISRNQFIENLIKNYFKTDKKEIDERLIVFDFLTKIDKEKIGSLNFYYIKKIAENCKKGDNDVQDL